MEELFEDTHRDYEHRLALARRCTWNLSERLRALAQEGEPQGGSIPPGPLLEGRGLSGYQGSTLRTGSVRSVVPEAGFEVHDNPQWNL